MKKNLKVIFTILVLVIVSLLVYIIYINKNIDKEKNINKDLKNTIANMIENSEKHDYDCTFTKTFRIINEIDYSLAPDGVSFVVVDDYQGYRPFVVVVPSTTVNLVPYNYYEFTYHLKGNGLINNFDDLNNYLIPSLFNKYNGKPESGTIYIDLDIKETSKVGVLQTNENICSWH